MSDFDWKKALASAAPTIGSLLSIAGPGGVLAGAALRAAAAALGTGESETEVSAAVAAMTPEQRVALAAADADLKKAVIAADVRKGEIQADTTRDYLKDAQDARSHNANTVGILRLGYFINAASYTCVFLTLAASFWLMGSRTELKVDPGIAAMLGTIIGAAVQWLLSNAAQANGFFFGSSPSSRASADRVGQAASQVPSTVVSVSSKSD